MMEFVNAFTKDTERPVEAMKQFTLLLAPFAPHIAEELWKILGGETTLTYEAWPQYDEAFAKDATVEIPIQIMGKLKHRIYVEADIENDALEAAALADETVKELLEGKQIMKTIVVPGKLVNFVAK